MSLLRRSTGRDPLGQVDITAVEQAARGVRVIQLLIVVLTVAAVVAVCVGVTGLALGALCAFVVSFAVAIGLRLLIQHVL